MAEIKKEAAPVAKAEDAKIADTVKVEAKIEEKKETKQAPAKKAAEKKPAVKKETAAKPKAPAKKTTSKAAKAPAKSKATAKKPAVKKSAVKNNAKKPADVAASVMVQYQDAEFDVRGIKASVLSDFSKNNDTEIKDLAIYIKPEDKKAYYVVNGTISGDIDI